MTEYIKLDEIKQLQENDRLVSDILIAISLDKIKTYTREQL